MMSHIIWIDKTDERSPLLRDILGAEGDWMSSQMTNIDKAAYVFVHETDLVSSIIDIRIQTFRDTIKKLDPNSKPVPRIILYTGNSKYLYESNLMQAAKKYFPIDVHVDYAFQISRNNKDSVARLKGYLSADNQAEIQKEEEGVRLKKDEELAIDLVAEVVGWLNIKNALSPEMKDLRTRLSRKFGEDGVGLVEILGKNIPDKKIVVKDLIIKIAKEKEANRLESWEKAGMVAPKVEN